MRGCIVYYEWDGDRRRRVLRMLPEWYDFDESGVMRPIATPDSKASIEQPVASEPDMVLELSGNRLPRIDGEPQSQVSMSPSRGQVGP